MGPRHSVLPVCFDSVHLCCVGMFQYRDPDKKATDLCTVTDKHARIVKCSQETNNDGKRTQESINYSTYQQKYLFNPSDGVWDLPLSEVNKLLYYSSTDDQENESNLVEIY